MIHTCILYVSHYGTTWDGPAHKVVLDGDGVKIRVT